MLWKTSPEIIGLLNEMCFQEEEKKGIWKLWESFTSGWFSFGNQAKTSITSDLEAKQELWTPSDTVGDVKLTFERIIVWHIAELFLISLRLNNVS